jgi:hypothetical protein
LWCIACFILALFDLNCIFLLGIGGEIRLAISSVTTAELVKKKKKTSIAQCLLLGAKMGQNEELAKI